MIFVGVIYLIFELGKVLLIIVVVWFLLLLGIYILIDWIFIGLFIMLLCNLNILLFVFDLSIFMILLILWWLSIVFFLIIILLVLVFIIGLVNFWLNKWCFKCNFLFVL